MKNNREYRNMMPMKAKEDSEFRAIGYASTFEQPYVLYEDNNYKIEEVIDRNAFDGCDMSDVIFQFDHEGMVYARQSNNTLIVRPDDIGLYMEAYLGGTTRGKELYESISGGYITKMSFGFTVEDEEWDEGENEIGLFVSKRRITRIGKLYDVSAVSIPANDATTISARSLTDGVIERAKAERLLVKELEEKRNRALARIKLQEISK